MAEQTDKEWLDELEDQIGKGWLVGDGEEKEEYRKLPVKVYDRLISMARRGQELENLTDKSTLDSVDDSIERLKLEAKVDELKQNLKDITKDPYEVEFRRVEAKVERYERTIRHITCDTKIINDRISEALEE